MNKEPLRQSLLTTLKEQKAIALAAADSAHDAATHEQSKAETQYDTVGLEAAYLAHGQSQRVADLESMIARIQSLALRDFSQDDEIDVGAIVTLNTGMKCWFLPVCGGYKLDEGKIVVITPQSPLGEMLEGAEIEEVLEDGRVITGID